MSRAPGAITHLSVLTPIRPGNEEPLAACLAALPRGARSPFCRLDGTHLARWVVIDQLRLDFPGAPWPPRPLRMQYLLFTSTFNGAVPHHLEELRRRAGVEADALWGHCVGYPGSRRRAPFHRYFRHNRLPTTLEFAAYQSTVAEIRAALDLRAGHLAFAVLAQRLRRPEDLRSAFREHFGAS